MKIPVFLLLLLLTTLSSSAQIERKPAEIKTDTVKKATTEKVSDKQSRKERMKDLDLTRDQQAKLKEIMQTNKAAKDAIDNNAQLSEQEKKKQLRELQKDQALKVQAVLTPEQREKFRSGRNTIHKNFIGRISFSHFPAVRLSKRPFIFLNGFSLLMDEF